MQQTNILLVDDLKDNLLALEALLRRADLKIFTAKSGTEALDLMITHEFALALIDVHMPMMSGFELAEFMRGTRKTKDIPIIFVSATAKDQQSQFKGYESGAVDFLAKPLDSHTVKNKVSIFIELFRRKREQEDLLIKLMNTQIQLEKAVRIRDEFMSIASHELNTPLTSMLLQTQLRKRAVSGGDVSSFTPSRLAKMFDSDEKQLHRISRLVEDMLDVTRINTGKLSLKLEVFDLVGVAQDQIERCSEQSEAALCPVSLKSDGPVVGKWDRFRIGQVIMNLLTNAIRYGSGKSIVIEVKLSPSGARMLVHDEGRGIAKENHERIFERFERAVSGSEISGLGLGLYIVRQVLGSHDGYIKVESELSRGATFIVDLPLNLDKPSPLFL